MSSAIPYVVLLLIVMGIVGLALHNARSRGRAEAKADQNEDKLKGVDDAQRIKNRIATDDAERQRVRDKYR